MRSWEVREFREMRGVGEGREEGDGYDEGERMRGKYWCCYIVDVVRVICSVNKSW